MPLPNFILVGAQRCGTSALWAMLNSHPDIYMGSGPRIQNEVHFFDRYWQKGTDWYSERFVPGKINGEKTPSILANPSAILRMHRTCPETKIVVSLRDPVMRFLSAHARWSKGRPVMRWLNRTNPGQDAFWRGCYVYQVTMLQRLFANIYYLSYEHLVADPKTALDRLCTFIGARPGMVSLLPTPRPRRAVAAAIRLGKLYAPHNASLKEAVPNLSERIDGWIGMEHCAAGVG